MNGEGTYIWPNERSLKAKWIDGTPLGRCEYTDEEGATHESIFDNDRLCALQVGEDGICSDPILISFSKPRLFLDCHKSFFTEAELRFNFIKKKKERKQKTYESSDSQDSRPTAYSNMNTLRTEGNEYLDTKNFDFRSTDKEN